MEIDTHTYIHGGSLEMRGPSKQGSMFPTHAFAATP